MRNGIGKGKGVRGDARVEAVIPNHVEASFGKTALVLQHVVEVLRAKHEKGEGGKGNRSASNH